MSPFACSRKVFRCGGALLLAGCLLLLSCVQKGQEVGRAWPARPNPTRIVWISAARSPQEVGIGLGFWGTLWCKITGDEQEVIGRPYGVHADCRKRILVVDPLKKGMHLFDREEKRYYFIGGAGVFSHPIGVTEDDHNVAYVTDSATGTVYRLNLGDRNPIPFAQGLKRPTGIVYSPRNELIYVTDTLAAEVVAYNRQGKEMFRFGRPGRGRGEFNLPTDLAVDMDGKIYVTDPLNARIEIFTAKGAYLKEFGSAGDTPGYFGKAKGVAVNSEGHIYVCDAQYDRVQVFNSDGKLLVTFGSTGSGKGEFWMPSGIAIDKDDNIYVADSFNNRIQLLGYVWLD